MYRVSYGEDARLSFDEARANLENKYNALFPGPKPVTGNYDLKMFSPYKLHQRCSSSFRVGRVLLAGDAAHACNPFGGMGLTGGLCDAGGLSDALIGVFKRGCSEDILDKYAEIRRNIFLEACLLEIFLIIDHESRYKGKHRAFIRVKSGDRCRRSRAFP
jgi:2-polyprenyl-6-methoxyphenol hydroxylase-like FAD-dependent oxidoreductase